MAAGVTTEMIEQAKALLTEGKSINAIAKALNVDWKKADKIVREIDPGAERYERGAPPKYSQDLIDELVKKFEKYISEEDIPIVAEFAYKNGITKQLLYERPDFSTLIKICTAKKETALERGALKGELNPTMAVFSLKQMGWTDKQQVESTNHNMNTDATTLTPEERRERIRELDRRRRIGTDTSS